MRRWLAFFFVASFILISSAYSEENYQRIAHELQNGTPAKKPPAILIFVSFSMPRQSLEAILRDAKKIHACVVIRGLIDDSFQKTYQRIAALVKSSDGDGMELNPLWFKRFKIQSVPSVVVLPPDSPCFQYETCEKAADYDQMTGNITISAALKMIRDKGRVARNVAQSALDRLQDTSHA